jgi:hypothetical protein
VEELAFHIEHFKDKHHRPFTWFFLKPAYEFDGYILVDYVTPYIVDRMEDENYFDYFFAVRLRLIDPMKIRAFLSYQSRKNFNNDINLYAVFLHDLIVKYKDLLMDEQINVIANKFIEDAKIGNPLSQTSNEADDVVSNIAVQTMAMHYLFKILMPDQKRKDAAKAKFIQMLTNKNFDNIYKAVQSPLASSSGNHRLKEMEIVRKYFQDLGLNAALELISQDFKS